MTVIQDAWMCVKGFN
uniref:Uncharacterized protein n=1 Tax=Anguilla anguilla TaxID=7936 RepID=A0A0E9PPB0_ANGAN